MKMKHTLCGSLLLAMSMPVFAGGYGGVSLPSIANAVGAAEAGAAGVVGAGCGCKPSFQVIKTNANTINTAHATKYGASAFSVSSAGALILQVGGGSAGQAGSSAIGAATAAIGVN